MQAVVFIDLDDTLFHSQRKCPAMTPLQLIARRADGNEQAWMTPHQRWLWQWLNDDAIIIPTTARDAAALRRVQLPFNSWCIVDFGGIILTPAGQPDTSWLAITRQITQAAHTDLQQLFTTAQTWIDHNHAAVTVRFITDFQLPLYLVVKYHSGHLHDLDQFQQAVFVPWVAAHTPHYHLHRNDNNLAVLPAQLDKRYAVQYLIQQLQGEWNEIVTIGVGDSRSDGAFMTACDYALLPSQSQLGQLLRTAYTDE